MASASIGMGTASIRERTLHMNARILLFVMLIAAASDARAAEPGGDPTVDGAIFRASVRTVIPAKLE